MRVEIRQPGPPKRLLENSPDRSGSRPVGSADAIGLELAVRPHPDDTGQEKRIVEPEQLFSAQISDPISHDGADLVPHREEVGRERLRRLGPHFARVLLQQVPVEIDMLELERGDRAVARAGQDGERDHGPVPPFNLGDRRHGQQDVADLFDSRHAGFADGLGHPRVLHRHIEVLGIGAADARLVAGLVGQPDEECFQRGQRRIDRGLAPRLIGAFRFLQTQVLLERLHLLDVEVSDVAAAGVRFESTRSPWRPGRSTPRSAPWLRASK